MPDICSSKMLLVNPPISPVLAMPGETTGLLRMTCDYGFNVLLADANLEFHKWISADPATKELFDSLSTKDFFDPVWYLRIKEELKKTGVRFDSDMSTPGSGQSPEPVLFKAGQTEKQIKSFWLNWSDKHLATDVYEILTVLLHDPDQVRPCLFLADICRQKHPQLKLCLALAKDFDKNAALPLKEVSDFCLSLDSKSADWPFDRDREHGGANEPKAKPSVQPGPSPQRVWRLKTQDLSFIKDLPGHFWISALEMTPKQIADLLPVWEKGMERPAVGLELQLDLALEQPDFSSWREKGICLVHWLVKEKIPGELKDWVKVLRQVSKMGIWNHLVLPSGDALSGLADFCTANPNMGHSWERVGKPLEPEDYASYGRAKSLPGSPFWLSLSRPGHTLLYLAGHGLTKLMRLRVIGAEQVYEVGQGLVYNYAKPESLPPGYLDQICHMVEDGGAVGNTWVRYNLERAHLIGFVEEKGVIVASGCLKHPRPEYIEMVKEQTGLDLTGHVERGYTTVRPEYRGLGIGTELLAGETARAGDKKVYSIISSDNLGAQKMALRNKTRKIATYFSPRLQKEISVWMPESMLP